MAKHKEKPAQPLEFKVELPKFDKLKAAANVDL